MRLLIVASAALALLCTPALAAMGKHPGARAPIDPGENVKVPPGHTGYDQIIIPAQNVGAPTELPADGKQRVACTTKEQLQDIASQATFAEAQDKIRRYVSFQDDGGDPPCAVFDWGQGTVTEAVLLPHTFLFSRAKNIAPAPARRASGCCGRSLSLEARSAYGARRLDPHDCDGDGHPGYRDVRRHRHSSPPVTVTNDGCKAI